MDTKLQLEGQPKKILVVDDNCSIRTMMVQLLSEEGYKVIEVEGAAKALNIVREQAIDLITLDLAMPGMSGNEFLVELPRQGEQAANIPIIVVSSNTTHLKATIQVKEVLSKPFDVHILTKTVEQILVQSALGLGA